MPDTTTWFVTGAGRGMGIDISRAALPAGHRVVATGRNTEAVANALGVPDSLLMVGLDLTHPSSARAAVVQLVDTDEPPLRWVADADAVDAIEQKAHDVVLAQIEAHRALSCSLAHENS